jgi:hypothetical protein
MLSMSRAKHVLDTPDRVHSFFGPRGRRHAYRKGPGEAHLLIFCVPVRDSNGCLEKYRTPAARTSAITSARARSRARFEEAVPILNVPATRKLRLGPCCRFLGALGCNRISKLGVRFPAAAKSDGVAVDRFSCRTETP